MNPASARRSVTGSESDCVEWADYTEHTIALGSRNVTPRHWVSDEDCGSAVKGHSMKKAIEMNFTIQINRLFHRAGRRIQLISLLALALVLVSGLMQMSHAARKVAAVTPSANAAAEDLGKLLNPDGTLRLDANSRGSFNPAGYRMELTASGAPRFVGDPAYTLRTQAAGDERWDSQFTLAGANNEVLAIVTDGTDVYVGGGFTAIGNVSANYIAKWNIATSTWSALGSGMDGPVWSLALSGTTLFAGGDFLQAGGVSANQVARWNGTAWSAAGAGLNDKVRALAVSGSDVYAGGDFSLSGSTQVIRIAKWNGTTWSAIGGGVLGNVYALAVSGSNLYAAGDFNTAGGVSANKVARWNGTVWSNLDTGMGSASSVNALAVSGTDLYAGGSFTTAGGVPANYIAKWNGTIWSPVGSGMNNRVNALTVSGADIYAGGNFTTAGGNSATHIAKWNGTAWAPLGSGIGELSVQRVNALATNGANVYTGGKFLQAGGVAAKNLAKWNGTVWSAFASGNGIDGEVAALASNGSDVYAGGNFFYTGNVRANNIAKWNGTNWSTLGSGLEGNVFALAVSGTTLYAGGDFSLAGGVTVNGIAKWDGSVWTALGSGVDGAVYALAVNGATLYAGGYFSQAGGVPANNLAKWNGSAWSSVGIGTNNGVEGGVRALAINGTNLYVGGGFIRELTTGTADNLAKWDGSAWSSIGNPDSSVHALLLVGTNLYAGGYFTTVDGVTVNNIARFNGTEWLAMADGVAAPSSSVVSALAVNGTDIYAGGFFDLAGGSSANYVAKWNGTAWSNLGSGTNSPIYALTIRGDDLYAGAHFTKAGDKFSNSIGRYAGGNTAPTIAAAATLTRQRAAVGSSSPIATVSDAETPANTLVVTTVSVPTGLLVTGITNTNGAIAATVAADCNAALGNNTVVLQVSDGALTATANLIVNVTAAPVPVITTQPISASVCPGGSASFSVAATNATGYQWRKDGVIIPGATNPMLALHSITQGEVGTYDVIVSGLCNTAVISSIATLTLSTPVSISAQPVSQTVCAGTQVTFSVTAAGTGLTYQWRKGGENITGATNAVFNTSANAASAGSYDVVVSGACGTMISAAALLTVNQVTAITTQPQNRMVCENGSVSFSVTANGAGLTYQWRKGGVNVSGATANTLTINAATAADAGGYDVVVTGACGTDISSAATLAVNSLTVISAQPVNQTVCAGASASFSVTATGTNLSYQWRKNGVAINGATGGAYVIPVTAASDAGSYDVIVSGTCGSVMSTAVALTVNAQPTITSHPPSKTICEGEFTNIPVFATGTGLSYQWRKNGVNIAGAITSTLQITSASLADVGNYDVVVTGACGAVTSNVASLTVNPRTALTAQPISQTVCAGTAVSFSVAATGSGLTYQWRKDNVNVSGATASTLVISAASMAAVESYDVIVTGACGVPVISNLASLTVNHHTLITTEPISQTFCAGAAVNLSVSATGSSLTYQWRKNGAVIAGATTNSFSIAAATASDVGSYDVVVTGACGTFPSAAASLTAQAATVITTQPSSLSVNAGQSATLSVSGTGANLTYQWRKNGSAISGAMASSYTIAAAATTDAGNYDVMISGACGNVTSNIATLTVNSVCGTPVVSLAALSGGGIYPIGTPVNFIGSFTDTGGQPHTATWNFTSNLVNVNQPGIVNVTTSTVFTNYNFTQAGVYQVTLTVANNCGNSGSASTIGVDQLSALVVIYDPGAGYVTGHGWITSPLGAYVLNPTLSGKANFGFVSKYKNGNNVPEGNTEFQFKAGNLIFKSTAYEWLVIAGARAQFKGTGTINNAGAYRFILTAIDGQENGGGGQDKFRIRIWNDAGGGLVYDNQLNAPDSADPTTVLGGGSIVIHKNGGNTALTAARVLHDFDGDGKSDVWSYRPEDGRWVVEHSGSHTLGVVRFGAANTVAAPADYDGDGRADVAVFTAATQRWQIVLSSTSASIDETFGLAEGQAFPADYDGDGKADLAVRTVQGEWQVRRSTDGESMTFKLGAADEQTVVGDFDGDGMRDASTYRASDGRWLIRFSHDGHQIERTTHTIHDAQIIAADFDGDGIDELAWWSIEQRELHFAGSTHDHQWQQWQTLSLNAKALLVGDYDGDGRADILLMLPAANGSMRWEVRLGKQHWQPTQ